jgi:ATP-dependent 26S proteasome regulatory subunit
MRTRLFWMVALGLPLLLIGGSPSLGRAGEAEQKAQAPAKAEKAEKTEEATKETTETTKASKPAEKPAETKKPAGLVGTVVAVTPASRAVVVDVPLGKQVLRIGAEVTDRTKIREGSKKASLADLKEGERVRINFRRVATGDEALSVDILRAAKC